jgi:CheY-like chemotaxis protein
MEDRMKRILIVDDDSDIRLILRSALESYGYHCDEASNGLEALEKIEAEGYALILLDYSMPVMNGLEIIRRLGQASGSSRPQIVMMTAHSGHDFRVQALDAGATAVLSKPFDLDHLLLTVGRTLKNGHPLSRCHHRPS